ncbi:DUF3829 domain-containing protein [Kosakonia sp. BK9b]|uniref:DUF3829 domain-containing protein n=1 Tax=Kosakonia sp. TaxID=1916651 RepID=UPI00289EFA67|nr:DUF3829 domain-containing protein [Kosakonia sp.]
MFTKNIVRSLAVAACLFALMGCDDKKSDQAQESQVSAEQAEQAEVLKYNEYIAAANMSSTTYADQLAQFREEVKPALARKKSIDRLYFNAPNPQGLINVKESLDKALAMKPDMPVLDEPARAYRDAVEKIQAVNTDMVSYINAKTYTSDQGAHGREIQNDFEARLQALVTAHEAFLQSIKAQDTARVKAAFEKAEKGTREYYHAGMIYYLKQSVEAAHNIDENTTLGDKTEAFKTSLDQFNAMALGYDAKVREFNKTGCPTIMSAANNYLGAARTVLQRSNDGTYEKEAQRKNGSRMMHEWDVREIYNNYKNVIETLNYNRC